MQPFLLFFLLPSAWGSNPEGVGMPAEMDRALTEVVTTRDRDNMTRDDMTSEKARVTSERGGAMTRCVKTGPCSCRTAEGGTLDLSPLADNVTARYKDVPDSEGADMYSWNPCRSFTETPDCVNVAACQQTIGLNESRNIGTQDSAQFIYLPSGELTLQYTYPDPSGVNRTTIVTLTCDPNAHDFIGVAGEMVGFQYSLTLTSKFACIKKPMQ